MLAIDVEGPKKPKQSSSEPRTDTEESAVPHVECKIVVRAANASAIKFGTSVKFIA